MSPVDRTREGYLDPDTFQVIAFAAALPPSQAMKLQNNAVYFPLKENFTIADVESAPLYRIAFRENRNRRTENSNVRVYSLKDILNLQIENIADAGLDLGKLDQSTRELIQIRKTLQKKACEQASARALYRWEMLSAPTSPGKPAKNIGYNERTLEEDSLPLAPNLPSDLFPPPPAYDALNGERIRLLTENLQKKKISYEIVEKSPMDSRVPACRAVVFLKKENLVVDFLHLADRL